MSQKIYYGIGPTFRSHVAKYGHPKKNDLLFDTFDYGKKIKLGSFNFKVLNPIENVKILSKSQIIICSLDYLQIQKNLKELIPNKLLNIKISDTILVNNESNSHSLIVSCPTMEKHGGVYKLRWEDENKKLDQLSTGDIRGIAFKENDLFALQENVGFGFIGPNGFELIKSIENKNLHSMLYIKEIDNFILAETFSDSIIFLDAKDFSEKKRLKWSNEGNDQHHINSLCFYDGYIYFSAFSSKGIWQQGIWNDGCIARISLDSKSMNDVEIISTGLRQPHSVLVDSSQSALCESQKRTFLVGTKVAAMLYGYTRGLCRISSGYFVGCSEIRRQNNFVKSEIPFAKGASINFISNDFSTVESFSLPSTSVYEIINDVQN